MQPDMTNPLIWFDSHCHFDFAEFDEVREDLVPQLVSNQCGGLVVPGVNTDNWDKLFELKKQYPKFMHIALGLHPYFMEQHHHDDILKLEEFLKLRDHKLEYKKQYTENNTCECNGITAKK